MISEISIQHPESKKEDRALENAGHVHSGVKCFECGGFGHKAYKCPKRKNQTRGAVNHLEPEGTVRDAVRGKLYAIVYSL